MWWKFSFTSETLFKRLPVNWMKIGSLLRRVLVNWMKTGSLLRRVLVTTLPNRKSFWKSSGSAPQICSEPEVFWKMFQYVVCEPKDLLLVFRFTMVKRLIRKSWSENKIKSNFFENIPYLYEDILIQKNLLWGYGYDLWGMR